MVLGAIGGKLYKIAPSMSLYDQEEATSAFHEIFEFCVGILGEASDQHDVQAIWDCSDGNVILHLDGALGYYQLDLIITSRAVRSASAIG